MKKPISAKGVLVVGVVATLWPNYIRSTTSSWSSIPIQLDGRINSDETYNQRNQKKIELAGDQSRESVLPDTGHPPPAE
jgi:hypothetical protein